MAILTLAVVTDMTWPRVCVAGLSDLDGWVRPVVTRGELTSDQLATRGRHLRPGDVISVPILPKQKLAPPHVEDRLCHLPQHRVERTLELAEFGELLRRYVAPSVAAAFNGQLEGRAVMPGSPCGSLVAVKATRAELYTDERSGKFRLRFEDGERQYTEIPVRDLRLMRYLQQRIDRRAQPDTQLLNRRICEAGEILLCLGLARPWAKEHDVERCWLQVNGLFTFPEDLLAGRQWDEFPEGRVLTPIE